MIYTIKDLKEKLSEYADDTPIHIISGKRHDYTIDYIREGIYECNHGNDAIFTLGLGSDEVDEIDISDREPGIISEKKIRGKP